MKSLYLRIYLTLVVLLLAFAFGSGWLFQRQFEQERARSDAAATERLAAMATLIHRSLPPADAPREEQAEALLDWSQRLRIPLALDDVGGQRVATSESYKRREQEQLGKGFAVRLEDERTLWTMRGGPFLRGARVVREGGASAPMGGMYTAMERGPRMEPGLLPGWLPGWLPGLPPAWHNGLTLIVLLVLLFLGVALGAFPVVRRLTRRLEALQRGVEQFGAGQLSYRVDDKGSDEVARLAGSFNRTAGQVELLFRSHQSLLANASHELRSPLARLKMALSLVEDASPAQRDSLRKEIRTNIAELDALVEEVLLASRLDGQAQVPDRAAHDLPQDLLGLAAEEAARTGAQVQAEGAAPLRVQGDERLLRRALRNLLENAKRYGGEDVLLTLSRQGQRVELQVCDRGPGVPEAMRERIFEPFFRLPGHAEQAGGVGLGLSLVKQIAQRHQGTVRCLPRDGGGSRFVMDLPALA
nr:HAMP domain-containing sensor histidine kinase [uncultured Roseateles sp.]